MITLSTDRLILRPQTFEDFERYAQLMASSRATGMGGPFEQRAAWALFCQDAAQWQFFGHGALMIDDQQTRRCLGQVGINHGPLFPEKELGWFIYDGYEGNGYATEAAHALKHWAVETLRLGSLVSYVTPANTRSAAVAERIGGVLDSRADRPDAQDLVYRYQ